MVVGREEEAAALAGRRSAASIMSASRTASSIQRSSNVGFVERDERVDEVGVVVEIGVELRLAVPPGVQQAAVGRATCAGRMKSAASAPRLQVASARSSTTPARASASIISAFQLTRTLSSLPGRTRWSRTASSLARDSASSASSSARFQPRSAAHLLDRLGQVQNALAVLEVALRRSRRRRSRTARPRSSPRTSLDLGRRPDVELAFLAFAVGVFGAVEAAGGDRSCTRGRSRTSRGRCGRNRRRRVA